MIRQWHWFRWNPTPPCGRWELTASFRWVRAEVAWRGWRWSAAAGRSGHRRDLGRSPGAWVNLCGLSVDVRFRRRRSRRPWGPMREVG